MSLNPGKWLFKDAAQWMDDWEQIKKSKSVYVWTEISFLDQDQLETSALC